MIRYADMDPKQFPGFMKSLKEGMNAVIAIPRFEYQCTHVMERKVLGAKLLVFEISNAGNIDEYLHRCIAGMWIDLLWYSDGIGEGNVNYLLSRIFTDGQVLEMGAEDG